MHEIATFDTTDAWIDACSKRIIRALGEALVTHDKAIFAGSGGSTPAPIYRRMAEADLDWGRIVVTLVDERYVPETSSDSNAALLKQTLMVGRASAAKFVPLYNAAVTVDRAAAMASAELKAEGGRLDAALLGMGEDGHICSMFPQSPTLKTLLTPDRAPQVLGVPPGRDGAAPSIERLSINLPYLSQAGSVILALKGRTKREVFEREADGDPMIHPIAALIAARVPLEVIWTEGA